jgi:hypothetical protein
VVAVRASKEERVEQLDDVGVVAVELGVVLVFLEGLHPFGVLHVLGHFLQNLDFVVGCLYVVRGAFHDLDSHVVIVLEVLGQPHC